MKLRVLKLFYDAFCRDYQPVALKPYVKYIYLSRGILSTNMSQFNGVITMTYKYFPLKHVNKYVTI